MNTYLDTSALVSLVLDDDGSPAARRWIADQADDLSLSDFGWGEFVAVVGSRARARRLSVAAADRLIGRTQVRFARWTWLETSPANVSLATTFLTSYALGLRLPDAIHLAIARCHGATLITTDHQQGDAAAALGIAYADPTRPSQESA